ncbi:MAG: phosphotransferase [Jatrophihabitans sp.]
MTAADATPLPHGSFSRSVERVSFDGRAAIRKTVLRGGDPAAVSFAEREAALLSSTLLDGYRAAGLPPPGLLGVDMQADVVTMYLADAGSQHVSTVAEAVEVARRAGRAQGGYLAELPDEPWLCGDFLADYAVTTPEIAGIEEVLADDAAWASAGPLRSMRAELTALWGDRHQLLELLTGVPKSLLHNDFWPANLMCGADGFVTLDWAFCGVGPIGADAANLVVDSIFDGYLPVAALPELDARVWPAYLAGLRESAPAIDPPVARLGFVAAGAVKYGWLGLRTLQRMRDGSLRTYGDRQDATAALVARVAGLRVVLNWAAEAREGVG